MLDQLLFSAGYALLEEVEDVRVCHHRIGFSRTLRVNMHNQEKDQKVDMQLRGELHLVKK